MEAQSFGDLIIQNIDSIEKCIAERTVHDQNTMMKLNESSGNECNIKENANNVSGNENNKSENKSNNDNYNVFTMEKEHPEQPESVNDAYMVEQGDTNTTVDSSDMSINGRDVDQDDDLAKELELLASLIEHIKIKN
nr:hypothetical protein [Tanacetum cinerariifolium]